MCKQEAVSEIKTPSSRALWVLKLSVFVLSILIISSSCDFKREHPQSINNSVKTSAKKSLCKSISIELSQFIDTHENRLNNYSDSIFYVVFFLYSSDNNVTEVVFRTSSIVPEILDTISVYAGHGQLNGKQIIVIDDRLMSSKNIYECFELFPLSDQFEMIKSNIHYTEFTKVEFSIKDEQLIEIK
jgi:hypothetical protein